MTGLEGTVTHEVASDSLLERTDGVNEINNTLLDKPIDALSENGDLRRPSVEDKALDWKISEKSLNVPIEMPSENAEIKEVQLAQVNEQELPIEELNKPIESEEILERKCLTDEEKADIKEKTGWSSEIVDAIRTPEEANIYMDADLVEGEINGKAVLLQPDIDWNAENSAWEGWTNRDLVGEGYPPRDANGRPYELHHIGQNPDSPLAELTHEQHHSNGNFKILHSFDGPSRIDRQDFGNNERPSHWRSRYENL